MRRTLKAGSWLLVAAMVAVGCSRSDDRSSPPRESYVYEPVRMAAAYLALMEKPDAVRALLIGKEAAKLREVFAHAGVKPSVAKPSGRYDIVLVACDDASEESLRRVLEYVSENGVLAWMMDLTEVTFAEFQRRFSRFPLPEAHLWMPGSGNWLLVGRRQPRQVKLAAMLDVFVREGAFADLAKARAATVPEMFASYAGTRTEILPVFNFNPPDSVVQPECFLTRDIPPIGWISAEGLDADITKSLLSEIRSLQLVRREVLEGKLASQKATDKAGEKAAIDKWHRAALRNPRDLMLLERLDRLDRNARGFLELGKLLQAMKCYETMILILPMASSVHNFGMCLEKIGKRDLAEQAFKRARELENGARP